MRDVDLEHPFLEEQDTEAWNEKIGPPRKDLVYHGDVRRLLEIREELQDLQKELSDFDENDRLPDDPFETKES